MGARDQRHGAAIGAPPEFEPATVPARARSQRGPNRVATTAWTRSAGQEGACRSTWGGLWALIKLATGVVLVVGASLGLAWLAHRYALTSPRFAIREIVIEGRQRVGEADLLKRGGIARGANIFALDTRQAEAALLGDPWIREAKIVRDWPGKLRIQVVESEAAALAAVGEHLYLVTRLGEPFKEVESGDPYDLPVVSGVTPEGLARDRVAEIGRIRSALEILAAYGKLGLARVHPAQGVELTRGGQAVLTVGKAGIALHLGKGPWQKKLLMAERVLAKSASQGQLPGIVFLDNDASPERVVVRMR